MDLAMIILIDYNTYVVSLVLLKLSIIRSSIPNGSTSKLESNCVIPYGK